MEKSNTEINFKEIYNIIDETFQPIKSIDHVLYEYVYGLKISIKNIEKGKQGHDVINKKYTEDGKETPIILFAELKIIEKYIEENKIERKEYNENRDQYSLSMLAINQRLDELTGKKGTSYLYSCENQDKNKNVNQEKLEKIRVIGKTKITSKLVKIFSENHDRIIKLKERMKELKYTLYNEISV